MNKTKLSIRTLTEREFINLSYLLADLIDVKASNRVICDIQGLPGTEKSLIADVILHQLQHEKGMFRVPRQNRMSMEAHPSQAAHLELVNVVSTPARNLFVEFIRSDLGIEDLGSENYLHLSLISRDFNDVSSANMIVKMTAIDQENQDNYWHRDWQIELAGDVFNMDKVSALVSRINNINGRQSRSVKSPQACLV